jgi:hypothetical protein
MDVQRRKFPRMAFLRPVHVRVQDLRGPAQRMFSTNLSLGGMYIRTPQPPESGALVDLSLEARGRALPFARGVVAFSVPLEEGWFDGRPPGFGVRFVDLPQNSKNLVTHILALRQAVKPRPRISAARPIPPARSPRKKHSLRWAVGASACLLALTSAVAVAPTRTLEAVEQYLMSMVNP